MLLAPARAGGRSVFTLVSASFSVVARAVTKVLGTQLLADLSGFVAALDSMFGGFRARAEQTYRVLQDRETAFLLVAAPEPDAVREAAYFAGRLATERMPLAGLVLNRVHRSSAAGDPQRRPGGGRAPGPAGPICCGCTPTRRLAARQREAAPAQRSTPACRWRRGRPAADIHDLDGLATSATTLLTAMTLDGPW